jgi:hypothetical protein
MTPGERTATAETSGASRLDRGDDDSANQPAQPPTKRRSPIAVVPPIISAVSVERFAGEEFALEA